MPQALTLKTRHIKEAILEYGTQNLIPHEECDFKLKGVETLLKTTETKEFEHYSKELLLQHLDKDKIINEHIELLQLYSITIAKKEPQDLKLVYTIDFERYTTHPKLILSPESTIPYKLYTPRELLQLLYSEINKIKAYHEILVQIFDAPLKKTLKTLVKYIYAQKFTKKVKIPLFDGIEPLVSRESRVIFWFKEKEHEGLIVEAEENEILVEYKKPLYGSNGFNAYGHNIDSNYAQNRENIDIQVDPKSIRIEDDANSKRYISRHRGYVHYTGKHLSVDNKLKLHEVSRNKHIIDSEYEENNIDIVVAQHDTSKDTIGEGVELISESIHIDGFVGANSRLEALHLKINGATHQDSKQYAKFATINRHKGTLRCHEANISLLEGGVVHGTTVNVESSIGGSIYAQDVIIGHTKNNLKVYASNSITVRLVSGEDNLFKINYRDIPILESKMDFINDELNDLKYQQEQAVRFHPQKVQLIKDEIETLKNEKMKIANAYQYATISVEQPFRGLNHIVFTLDEENEIHYKTEAKAYAPFRLEIDNNRITLLPPKISLTIE